MNITNLLIEAQNSNYQIRNQAELKLTELKEQDPLLFINLLSNELQNEEKPTESRQLSGLLLKSMLVSKDKKQRILLGNEWISYSEKFRQEIKSSLYQTFNSSIRIIRHTSALVLAEIILIELYRGYSQDAIVNFVDEIPKNIGNDFLIESILKCVGFILEDIEDPLKQNESEVLFQVILKQSQSENIEIKKSSLFALYHLLEFIDEMISNEEQYQKDLFNIILNEIQNQNQNQNEEIYSLSFEILVKISYLYYDILGKYIDQIFKITSLIIQKGNDNICIKSIEFWSSLSAKEKEIEELDFMDNESNQSNQQSQNFIRKFSNDLISILLEKIENEEDIDYYELSPTEVSILCLSEIGEIMKDDILQHITDFIERNISSNNSKQQKSAITVFGTILENVSTEKIGLDIPSITSLLQQMFSDPNDKIRESISWTISRICQYHCSTIISIINSVLNQVIQHLDDIPSVSANCCWSISFILIFIGNENQFDLLDVNISEIIEKLLLTIQRQDVEESNLKQIGFQSIIISISQIPNQDQDLFNNIFIFIIEHFEKTLLVLKKSKFSDIKQDLYEYQTGFIEILQGLIEKFDKNTLLNYLERIMNDFFVCLEDERSSHSEILLSISLLINFIGDLYREYPDYESIIQSTNEIIDNIIKIVKSNDIEMTKKPIILGCLADIIIGVNSSVSYNFIEDIMILLDDLFKTQTNFNDDNENDEILITSFQKSILDIYTSICQRFSSDGTEKLIIKFIPQITNTINQYSKISLYEIEEEIIESIIGLFGDLIQCFGIETKSEIDLEFIIKLLDEMIKNGTQENKDLAQWIYRLIK
ncbi:importin subunit beta-1 [Anaeramoeba ignava]|uniref:Importin subunit beta-1 n=1 Tax=Anaeramoeba ignava TaxID=1746090 RepID=A0A9Q0RCL1_ANAIG|nr:importin subunit beta-1 [Anaeramoeba ignava]